MVETVTDIIVARSREPEGLQTMIVWSIAAHIALLTTALLWGGPGVDEAPRIVMTVSLSGAPGPDTGGKTQIGGQAVQAPPPPGARKARRGTACRQAAGDDTTQSAAPAAAAATQGRARAGAARSNSEDGEYRRSSRGHYSRSGTRTSERV